jgi:hypothetical protein
MLVKLGLPKYTTTTFIIPFLIYTRTLLDHLSAPKILTFERQQQSCDQTTVPKGCKREYHQSADVKTALLSGTISGLRLPSGSMLLASIYSSVPQQGFASGRLPENIFVEFRTTP